jgi:hypothetical protein
MEPHFFKVMWRSLLRSKMFAIINTLGLSIGIAGVILIAILIGEMLRVDQFHEKKDRLYRVYKNEKDNSGIRTFPGTSSLLAPYVKTNYTGAEEVVRTFLRATFFCILKTGTLKRRAYLPILDFCPYLPSHYCMEIPKQRLIIKTM